MKFVRYFKYLFRHKWFVFWACWKYGLIWQGIIHDWSKFLPDEVIPYANFFYAGDRRKDSFYTAKQGSDEFNVGFLKHLHRNPHHWQHWILAGNEFYAIPIPEKYAKEMLCDWIGAGLANGNNDILGWYKTNREKMIMHEHTRAWIERELGYNATSNS